jgi:hypothetical protein
LSVPRQGNEFQVKPPFRIPGWPCNDDLDDGCAIMSSGQSVAVVEQSAFIERAEVGPITSANIRSAGARRAHFGRVASVNSTGKTN